jgi:uncharacterized membrane protein YhaH (DUF805 family)
MWYLFLNNQNVGPISADDVRGRLSRGEIGLTTHVWREGMPDWVSLGSTELVGAAPPVAGSPPVPSGAPVAVPTAHAPASVFDYYMHAFKCYATFSGRARRSEYWYFVLFNFIAQIILGVVGTLSHFPFFSAIYSIGVLVPNLAVSARRLHDSDKSGWFILIPLYNLYLLCRGGTIGTNRFGDDPVTTGLM